MISKMGEFGSPSSYSHYAVGWAWAMNTPFQWTKQVPRTGVAHATGQWCTGRAGSRGRAVCASRSPM